MRKKIKMSLIWIGKFVFKYYFGKYLMFHRTSWALDLFFPPTGVVFRLAATSFADLLLWNSIQPSVNCLAILSFRFCFSFISGCRKTQPTFPNCEKKAIEVVTLNPGGIEER